MNINILLLILIPLSTAFLIPLIDLIQIKLRRFLVFIASSLELFFSVMIILNNYSLLKDGEFFLKYNLGGWSPPFGIILAMDSLSLFFSTLISLALFLIIIYSIGFIGYHEGKYYVLLFLVLGSMQGAIITGDIFNLYVFIELLTVSSAPLVAFKRSLFGTEAAIKYMFYGIVGGLFFFIGVILLYFNLGTLNMAEISANFTNISLNMQIVIMIFFLISLLIKLAIFPFHFWLPKAHSACPSSISALLSGVLMKIYIYIFIRIFWIVLDFSVFEGLGLAQFIIYLALFSSLIGHILALQADDIKRMLAYSTIGHIGMIVGVISLNTAAGFYGGLLHVISHLFMKTSLFTESGYLLQYTKSHRIEDFAGSGYKNQGVFISFIISSLGMIGIPPLIGFISKWYILLAFLEVDNHFGAILVILGSLTAIVYYMRYISHGYKTMKIDENLAEKDFFKKPILSVFYREDLVTSVIYILTAAIIISGVVFKIFEIPINASIQEIMNPENYIDLVLGGK